MTVFIFFRPEQHGPELVKLLSQILNQCGSEQDGQSSALALQGITALCNAESVNIATTWRALAQRLSRDKRPVVIKRYHEGRHHMLNDSKAQKCTSI
jgi:hypothetical protein